MPKKEVLDFKPAPRPEQVDDKRPKQMEDRKHRRRGCADSASSRESVRMRFLGMTGNRRRNISFAIGIVSMAMSLSVAFARWAFGTGRSHHDRHGRTGMRRGSSVRFDGIALTMSLFSASGIFATCWDHT